MNALDDLAQQVRERGLILSYSRAGYAKVGWNARYAPAWLLRAIYNHRYGLARMMREGRIEVCCSPDAHRASWFYAGNNRYRCAYCMQLDQAQIGLWQKVS